MKFHRRFRRLRLRTLAVTLFAGLALAAPAASARPVEQYLEPASSCEEQWVGAYGTPAPSACEQQALASRGSGASAEPVVSRGDALPLPSADAGLEWGSAALGAAVGAGLIALAVSGMQAVRSRNRVRTAR